MTPPDWDRLRKVNAELRQLASNGSVTRADWERLEAEAREAVGEHTPYLEGFLMRGIELGFVKPPTF